VKKLQLFIHNVSDALRIELAGNLLDAWRKESPHQCAVPAVADIGYVADADKHSRTVLVKWHCYS
jgi:hypothetical protein